MRLSKSKILTFEKCPFLFKLIYIDDSLIKKRTAQMERGVDVHELAFELHKDLNLPLTEKVNNIMKHPLFKSYPNEVRSIVRFDLKRGKPEIIKVEEKIYDEEIDAVGIYDRVDKEGDKIFLWDYKTGKPDTIKKYRFELALYTYLFEKNNKERIDCWGIYFIDHGIVKFEERNDYEIKRALEKVKQTNEMIERRVKINKFERNPNWHCPFCPAYLEGKCGGK